MTMERRYYAGGPDYSPIRIGNTRPDTYMGDPSMYSDLVGFADRAAQMQEPAYARAAQQSADLVAPAAARETSWVDAAGGPVGLASMGLQTGADIFDAYQNYKARKEQRRLARKMERRQDIAWNQGMADDARARRDAYLAARRARAQQALSDIDMLRERQRRGYI